MIIMIHGILTPLKINSLLCDFPIYKGQDDGENPSSTEFRRINKNQWPQNN